MKVTNTSGVSLPLAVWLLHDDYDYVDGVENYISVTRLMKPLRQIIIPPRIPPEEQTTDVTDFIARKLGHAIHDSIEKSWHQGYERSLGMLGIPADVVATVRLNPDHAEIVARQAAGQETIPVYLEQRAIAQIDGFNLGGKFDMVSDGIVNDFKSTSAWAWAKGTRDEDHILQMSLYRWIDSKQEHRKITEDYGRINYVFTDWSKAMARSNPKYPQHRVEHKDLALMSVAQTEAWISDKLRRMLADWGTPEKDLPECTDEELWRSDPAFKYFSDPLKSQQPGARSTRNFDTLAGARAYMAEKGGKGAVITVPGEVKACGYCPAFDGCTQKDQYL